MAAQPGLPAFRKIIHMHTRTNTHRTSRTSEIMVGSGLKVGVLL